jgi:serine/threonine protein phosphatase PrpC
MISDIFSVRHASIQGRLHQEKGINNQDSYVVAEMEDALLVVLADGCSGSPHAEVGAYLTTRYLLQALSRQLMLVCDEAANITVDAFEYALREARLDTLTFIRSIASQLGDSLIRINDAFLSTCLGVLINKQHTFMFSIGDGYFILNGEVHQLDHHEGNAPDMLIYGALPAEQLRIIPKVEFDLQVMPTEGVESLIVATDGLEYFINAEGQNYPGYKEKIVPPVSELVASDVPLLAQLSLANKTSIKPLHDKEYDILTQKVEKGYLLDDTTVVVIKRREPDPS